MNVYLVVERDETGKVREKRVPANELAAFINTTFIIGGIEILAIIKI